MPPGRGWDLAIVGAGIIGATAAALAARRRPHWRILLLDRSRVGHGASRHSGGLATRLTRSPRHRALSTRSAALYADLRRQWPGLPIRSLPLFFVCDAARQQDLARACHGPPPTPVEAVPAAVESACPWLTLPQGAGLLDGGTALHGQVTGVAERLVAQVTGAPGGGCWEGVEVRAVEPGPRGMALACGDGRTLEADRVLVTTGPWLPSGPGADLAARAGVRLKKIVALHLSLAPAPASPVLYLFDHGAFLLPLPEAGGWLFSFTCTEWDCPPETSRLRITSRDRETGLALLARYAPSLVPRCTGGRVFCDAYTPDGVPLITAPPGETRMVVAGGGSGSGFRLAPGIAEAALDRFPA